MFEGLRNLLRAAFQGWMKAVWLLVFLGWLAHAAWKQPPFQSVARDEVGLRSNRLTGSVTQFPEGKVLVIPGVHELRLLSLRDRAYHPNDGSSGSPIRSSEGLPLSMDFSIGYSFDAAKLAGLSGKLPENIEQDVVAPAVQTVVSANFARHNVQEIRSAKIADIQQEIKTELATKLAHEGMVLRELQLSKVDLAGRLSLRDHVYRPNESGEGEGSAAPFQSVEGLSLGVDLSIRYALDPARVAVLASQLPDDIDNEIVGPAVKGVIYKTFTRYSVKEIFSTKRAEILASIETDLQPRLNASGILLRDVQVGKVELPADYRAGMEKLLQEELETEKMKYTLTLKEQQVKQTSLEAEADKVRRDKAAEAAGNEQVIAAKAQEEAMKHVLPFKQKQIEQRKLEADADKITRVRNAEATAESRRIEASGEADSRQKLADAESYRLERIGKITSAQMERDGELLSKHPLLIQKTMADKLSDKISVIIAPPPASGGFIGSALLGQSSKMQMQSSAE